MSGISLSKDVLQVEDVLIIKEFCMEFILCSHIQMFYLTLVFISHSE
jgi:hypothetical protein